MALQSLWANKLRSVLTLLGVGIGVASVIMVVTLTNGAKRTGWHAVEYFPAVTQLFGIYPASKAANLDPIEALRYE